MAISVNIVDIASSPIKAGLLAAAIVAIMNYLYKWKSSDKPTSKSIAYNAILTFVMVAIAVVYAKKGMLIPDEFIDTRPPPF